MLNMRSEKQMPVRPQSVIQSFQHKDENGTLMGHKWPYYCMGIPPYFVIFPSQYEE